jgi:ATP-dependent Clp protease ATP-binding subunit ClpA
MGDNGLTIELTQEARQWLAETGYDSAFGARPLRRALQKYLESPLSLSLLSGEFPRDAHIIADVNEAKDGLEFSKSEQSVKVPVPQETAG